jgi:hypothetical protein
MVMFKRKEKENLLNFIPFLKPAYRLEPIPNEKGLLQVVIPRTSLIERFSVLFLKQPALIRVRLDELGSFVLSLCDGQTTVSEIEEKVEKQFGEKAEPVLPRLVKFFEILEANDLIDWKREP